MRVFIKDACLLAAVLGWMCLAVPTAMADDAEGIQISPEADAEVVYLAEPLEDERESRVDCENFGAAELGSSGENRLRGDVIEMAQDAEVDTFKVELRLNLGQTVDIYFYIHRKEESGLFTRVWPPRRRRGHDRSRRNG